MEKRVVKRARWGEQKPSPPAPQERPPATVVSRQHLPPTRGCLGRKVRESSTKDIPGQQ